MTGAYLDSRKVEVNLNGVWVDITADVVSSIKVTGRGMAGNGPLDRVATIGTMTFDLNNADKRYSPGSATCSPYWIKGIAVRLTLTFEGADYIKFYGKMDNEPIQSGTVGSRRTTCHFSDWMSVASTTPITLTDSYANKRADEGVALILNVMPIPPLARLLSATTDTFALIFDTVAVKTKALTEFGKLILSEFGYLYLRTDRVYGETLVVEGRHDRDAGAAQQVIPVSKENSGALLLEDGGTLLLEDGGRLLLNESTTYDFDKAMQSLDAVYGSEVYNYVSVRNYPREVGASVAVLFKLNAPIGLQAGETKTNILGSFIDPLGGGTPININTPIAPAANTDYKMFANSDGTGTDLTANLVVTAAYTPSSVIYTLHNTGASNGYVTLLQARGYPVKMYNPIEQWNQDDASILQNGYSELIIDQKYSPTILPNVGLAAIELNQEKNARTMIGKLSALANTNYETMISFLVGDIGSLEKVVEDQTITNGQYFIQQISFEIAVSGIVTFDWLLIQALSLSAIYWHINIAGQSEIGVTTTIGY
jgi:hypothetical protein